jgi:hypothetical protein
MIQQVKKKEQLAKQVRYDHLPQITDSVETFLVNFIPKSKFDKDISTLKKQQFKSFLLDGINKNPNSEIFNVEKVKLSLRERIEMKKMQEKKM